MYVYVYIVHTRTHKTHTHTQYISGCCSSMTTSSQPTSPRPLFRGTLMPHPLAPTKRCCMTSSRQHILKGHLYSNVYRKYTMVLISQNFVLSGLRCTCPLGRSCAHRSRAALPSLRAARINEHQCSVGASSFC